MSCAHIVVEEVFHHTPIGTMPELGDSLAGDLGLDSLDVIEIAMRLEVKLERAIEDTAIETWHSVQDIVDYFDGAEKDA